MKLEEININLIKIDTGRLLLRPFEEKDLDDLHEYASVPGVGEAAGWNHHASKDETAEVLKQFIEAHRTFAIEEKESGKVIGSISFEASSEVYNDKNLGENINDIGYVISQDYWGKGYATEALKGIINYAFYVLHLDAVTCGHFADNEASKAVIEKNGFKYICEGKYTAQNGKSHDAKYYALTHLDFGVEYSHNLKKD